MNSIFLHWCNAKHMLFFVCASLIAQVSFAQNNLGSSDDAARIAITPYVSPELGFNDNVVKQLTSKMNSILTKNGLAGTDNQRFVMTANAVILSEDIVMTTKEMFQSELEVHFTVGDGVEGIKFSSASQIVKSVGETKADAFINALKKIKASDEQFQEMISTAKNRIIEYFNSNCDIILTQAKTLADNGNYDAAIFVLMSVPTVCKDCYEKCMAEVKPIYQNKIDQEGQKLLSEARSLWMSGMDEDAADAASQALAKIDPNSSAAAGVDKLVGEMKSRLSELERREMEKEQREWEFAVQKHKDEVALEEASIQAIKDIAIEYNKQQKQQYKQVIYYW